MKIKDSTFYTTLHNLRLEGLVLQLRHNLKKGQAKKAEEEAKRA
jgi:hypothetical protein